MATQQFITRHYRPVTDPRCMSDVQSTSWGLRRAQTTLRDGTPGDAGPCYRNASRDAIRRHAQWLSNMAYLRKLAEDRANDVEVTR